MPVNLTPAQFRVLAAVEELGPEVSIADLTSHFGGHPNASRRHLGFLEGAELISTSTTAGHASGRPAKLYSITDAGRKVRASHTTEQARLDALSKLALHIAGGEDAGEISYEIGQTWGRAERDEIADDPMKALTRQGFAPAPTSTDGEFILLACPLLQVAQQAPTVICSMHRGYLDGAMTGARTTLVPFASPRGCRVTIERP